MRKAIYPGSFDPMHEGHIAIIEKARKLFDVVYVVVSNNPEKTSQTPIKTRYYEVAKKLNKYKDVVVEINEGHYTAHYAKEKGINFLVRSARNEIDYNYELELAAGNNHLNHELETILIIPDYKDIHFESRLIKQKTK